MLTKLRAWVFYVLAKLRACRPAADQSIEMEQCVCRVDCDGSVGVVWVHVCVGCMVRIREYEGNELLHDEAHSLRCMLHLPFSDTSVRAHTHAHTHMHAHIHIQTHKQAAGCPTLYARVSMHA